MSPTADQAEDLARWWFLPTLRERYLGRRAERGLLDQVATAIEQLRSDFHRQYNDDLSWLILRPKVADIVGRPELSILVGVKSE